METNNTFRLSGHFGLTKLLGSLYFVLLAVANAVGMALNAKFGLFDFFLLVAVAMPLAINRNWFYKFFGFANVMVWLLVALSVIAKIYVIEIWDFFIGFGLALSAIAAGLTLVYSGTYAAERS
jgi:hypothetical protein